MDFEALNIFLNFIRIQGVNRRLKSEYGVSHPDPQAVFLPMNIKLTIDVPGNVYSQQIDGKALCDGVLIFVQKISLISERKDNIPMLV